MNSMQLKTSIRGRAVCGSLAILWWLLGGPAWAADIGDDPPPASRTATTEEARPRSTAEKTGAGDVPAMKNKVTDQATDSVPSKPITTGGEAAGMGDAKSDESSGFSRTDALIASLTIFVLAIFVGFELITKVPPTLHTPLMSGSNAISGITIVGAILMAGSSGMASFVGMLAMALATINVIGGFMVTDRMLSMFRKR